MTSLFHRFSWKHVALHLYIHTAAKEAELPTKGSSLACNMVHLTLGGGEHTLPLPSGPQISFLTSISMHLCHQGTAPS